MYCLSRRWSIIQVLASCDTDSKVDDKNNLIWTCSVLNDYTPSDIYNSYLILKNVTKLKNLIAFKMYS